MLLKWPSPQHLPELKTKTVTTRSERTHRPAAGRWFGLHSALRCCICWQLFVMGAFIYTMEASGFSGKTGRPGEAGCTFLMRPRPRTPPPTLSLCRPSPSAAHRPGILSILPAASPRFSPPPPRRFLQGARLPWSTFHEVLPDSAQQCGPRSDLMVTPLFPVGNKINAEPQRAGMQKHLWQLGTLYRRACGHRTSPAEQGTLSHSCGKVHMA